MPPSMQPQRQWVEENEPLDARSDWASSLMLGDRGEAEARPEVEVKASSRTSP